MQLDQAEGGATGGQQHGGGVPKQVHALRDGQQHTWWSARHLARQWATAAAPASQHICARPQHLHTGRRWLLQLTLLLLSWQASRALLRMGAIWW